MDEDQMYEMYHKDDDDWKLMLKVYGCAFGFFVCIILPWAVGAFTLGRWIFFN